MIAVVLKASGALLADFFLHNGTNLFNGWQVWIAVRSVWHLDSSTKQPSCQNLKLNVLCLVRPPLKRTSRSDFILTHSTFMTIFSLHFWTLFISVSISGFLYSYWPRNCWVNPWKSLLIGEKYLCICWVMDFFSEKVGIFLANCSLRFWRIHPVSQYTFSLVTGCCQGVAPSL